MGWGAAAGAAVGIASSVGSAFLSAKLQKKAQKHAEKMYKHKYQWTMSDMQKAGLNPILAYQQGAGATGSPGGVPSIPDFGASAARGAEAGLKTTKVEKEQALLAAQTGAANSNSAAAIAAADHSTAQAKRTNIESTQLHMKMPRLQALEAFYRTDAGKVAAVVSEGGGGIGGASARAVAAAFEKWRGGQDKMKDSLKNPPSLEHMQRKR